MGNILSMLTLQAMYNFVQLIVLGFILDIYLPEWKEDVKDDFSSKSITPASQEKGDNDWEKMINNALVNLLFCFVKPVL